MSTKALKEDVVQHCIDFEIETTDEPVVHDSEDFRAEHRGVCRLLSTFDLGKSFQHHISRNPVTAIGMEQRLQTIPKSNTLSNRSNSRRKPEPKVTAGGRPP